MTKLLSNKALILAAMLAVFAVLLNSYLAPRPVAASTLAYAVPHVATSSTIVVGPANVVTIAAVASNCTGRAISTVTTPIQLSFSPLLLPSGITGHIQSASTSVMYNNGDYGCGAITAYANASTTITVTSFAQ